MSERTQNKPETSNPEADQETIKYMKYECVDLKNREYYSIENIKNKLGMVDLLSLLRRYNFEEKDILVIKDYVSLKHIVSNQLLSDSFIEKYIYPDLEFEMVDDRLEPEEIMSRQILFRQRLGIFDSQEQEIKLSFDNGDNSDDNM